MKQLSFFSSSSSPLIGSQQSEQTIHWKLFIDGAARNNPGPAGAGICLMKHEKIVSKSGIFLGSKTNNQAEYFALIFGLFLVNKEIRKQDLLLIISDSQLLVRQMQGLYKVKETHLKPLYGLARQLVLPHQYSIAHVLREENSEADEQANYAIDHKIKAPPAFIEMLRTYELSI